MENSEVTMDTKFARIAWTASDVKELRPNFTDQQCIEAIENCQKLLRDRSIEEGWIILGDLLDLKDIRD